MLKIQRSTILTGALALLSLASSHAAPTYPNPSNVGIYSDTNGNVVGTKKITYRQGLAVTNAPVAANDAVRLVDLQGATNSLSGLQSQINGATNRIQNLEDRSNTWNTAATVAADATNRVSKLEGGTNQWNAALTNAYGITGVVASVANNAVTIQIDPSSVLYELFNRNGGSLTNINATFTGILPISQGGTGTNTTLLPGTWTNTGDFEVLGGFRVELNAWFDNDVRVGNVLKGNGGFLTNFPDINNGPSVGEITGYETIRADRANAVITGYSNVVGSSGGVITNFQLIFLDLHLIGGDGDAGMISNFHALKIGSSSTSSLIDMGQAGGSIRYVQSVIGTNGLQITGLERLLGSDTGCTITNVDLIYGKAAGGAVISGFDGAFRILTATSNLTVQGIRYPISDGTSNQVVVTDGAGHLSFVAQSSSGGNAWLNSNQTFTGVNTFNGVVTNTANVVHNGANLTITNGLLNLDGAAPAGLITRTGASVWFDGGTSNLFIGPTIRGNTNTVAKQQLVLGINNVPWKTNGNDLIAHGVDNFLLVTNISGLTVIGNRNAPTHKVNGSANVIIIGNDNLPNNVTGSIDGSIFMGRFTASGSGTHANSSIVGDLACNGGGNCSQDQSTFLGTRAGDGNSASIVFDQCAGFGRDTQRQITPGVTHTNVRCTSWGPFCLTNAHTLILSNAHGIGVNAQVSGDNQMALGGIGTDAVKVMIATNAPAAQLTVHGDTRLGQIGTTFSNIISATASLDFGTIGASSTSNLLITVTGTKPGDAVAPGWPTNLVPEIQWVMIATNDAVVVSGHNDNTVSGVATTPGTYRATIIGY